MDGFISGSGLSGRSKRALIQNEITTIHQLRQFVGEYGKRGLHTRLPGIGRKSAREILEFLETSQGPDTPEVGFNVTISMWSKGLINSDEAMNQIARKHLK